MASTSQQDPPRRLAQFLQEQQEPFVLEIYLLERGCRRRNLLKRSSSCKSSGKFSNIARSLYDKIVSINRILKVKKSKAKKEDKKVAVLELDNRISSASSSTLCNTCSESDIERESFSSSPTTTRNTILETAPDRIMTKWRIVEENKQCSPVSVLDEIDFLQGIPVFNVKPEQEADTSESRIEFQKKVSEDSILSASLWELLLQSRENQKIKQNNKRSKPFPLPRYISSKKALQQTRQLFFDCVREVVEGHNNINGRKEKGLMGAEEIGRIMCSNLKSWGKVSGKGTKKISQLLRSDLMLDSPQEWWGGGSHHEERREIAFEIGDDILQVITDEIVTDMIDDQYY